MQLDKITDDLIKDMRSLNFGPPVTHVYNPLEYARQPYNQYLNRFAKPFLEVVLLGMNPGPWGMAQTGVPFGEVTAVKKWMGIDGQVHRPANMHPKRPIMGFDCNRNEVSGKRLWGWAQKKYKTPERFFARFFVANYCPLLFIESGGRNRTPNQLHAAERHPLQAACDRAIRRTIELLKPNYVIGVGQFARQRAQIALAGLNLIIGTITHPSPANPKANRGWESLIEHELFDMGIRV